MKIISVNVARPREIPWNGEPVLTGIYKKPVEGPVSMTHLNLMGDQQADLTVHGGPQKAIYGYPSEHYEFWRGQLPEAELEWGEFGENLTTDGLLEDSLHIGDVLQIGSARLQVTQPRLPCYKLALKFGRDDIIPRFLRSLRSGFYFSVVEEGEIHAASAIEILSRDSQQVSIRDILRLHLGQTRDQDLIRRALNTAALPNHWKRKFAEMALEPAS